MLAEVTGSGKIKFIYVKTKVKKGGGIDLGVGGASVGGAKRGRKRKVGGAVTGGKKRKVRRGRGLGGLADILGGSKPKRTKRTRKGGAVPKGASSWVTHIKQYAKSHNIPYGQAMHDARASYKSK